MGVYSNEKNNTIVYVGGWTNPSEKYDRQIGSFPQVGVNIIKKWNHHLVVSSKKVFLFPPEKMPKKAGFVLFKVSTCKVFYFFF